MDEYGLSSKELLSIFKRLIVAGAVKKGELDTRMPPAEDRADVEALRRLPRNYLVVAIPVYDADDLFAEGRVIDVTEKGLQVAGLSATAGEKRSLLIQADEFVDVHPFVFDCECRWVRLDEEHPRSGFEITSISEGGLVELRKLIDQITLGS
jgi:hypothetical protein